MALTQVSTNGIKDATIATADIADDAITGAKIADDAVAAEHLASNAVVTASIVNDAVTADKLANSINTEIAANTAKTTNATHSGEVTGATALTIADNVVDEANLKISNSPTNGQFLSAQSGNTGGLTWAAIPAGVGGATGVDFNDNVEARFGAGNDLQIYHDGSNSYLDNDTGNLFIRNDTGGGGIYLRVNQTEAAIAANKNGSVELYYDNVLKLNTESAGTRIQGQLILPNTSGVSLSIKDGGKGCFGNGDDLQIYHDGSDSSIHNATGDLTIRSDAFYVKSGDNSESLIRANKDGDVELYNNNEKKFYTQTWGVTVADATATSAWLELVSSDGTCGYLVGQSNAGSGSEKAVAFYNAAGNETLLRGINNGSVELYYNNSKKFETTADGAACSSLGTDNSRLYFLTSGHTTTRIGYVGLGKFGMDVNGGVQIRDAGNSYETMFNTVSNGAAELYYDGSKKFETSSSGATITGRATIGGDTVPAIFSTTNGSGGYIQFDLANSGGNIGYIGSPSQLLSAGNHNDFAIRATYDLRLSTGGSTLRATLDTSGNFYPAANNSQNLGANGLRWSRLYAQNAARAWINVDGDDSTANIRASYNVSSLTDDAYERHTVNFNEDFGNTNYCFVTGARAGGSGGGGRVVVGYDPPNAGYFKYQMRNLGNNNEHVDAACLAFFGT